jgi:hypothetical protein
MKTGKAICFILMHRYYAKLQGKWKKAKPNENMDQTKEECEYEETALIKWKYMDNLKENSKWLP